MILLRNLPIALPIAAVTALCIGLLIETHSSGWIVHTPPAAAKDGMTWITVFLVGWMLMTGAMTMPSSLPFLQTVERVAGSMASTAAATGILLVWLMAGMLISLVLWLSGGIMKAMPPGGAERLAATILLFAAVYQISPLASACQRFCASPFAILARWWRGEGRPWMNAFGSGTAYGVSCLGCCVPMMFVMLLVGMNDLRWMFGLGAVMVAQKHPVWGWLVAPPAALLLAASGIAIQAGWWSPELASLRSLCGA